MKPAPTPSINIVTPSFNQDNFIQETIESVLSQMKSDDSYWVIDGGSSDKTISVLKRYGKRLGWVSAKDKGQTDAINRGVRKTLDRLHGGDIIAYLNSDDYYLPGTFDKVRRYFQIHPTCMWLVGDALIVNETGTEIQTPVRWYKKLLRMIPGSIWLTNPYPQPSVFLRAELVRTLGLFDESLHYVMDYDYWLRVSVKVGAPASLAAPLSAFRIHATSKGKIQFEKQFAEDYKVLNRYTTNLLVLTLHRFHNWLILWIYRRLK